MLYQLAGGLMLYSATERVSETTVSFEARESVFLQPVQGKGGKVDFQIVRADKTPWKMATLHVPWHGILMYHDCDDAELLASIKSELTGLTLPPSGLHVVGR